MYMILLEIFIFVQHAVITIKCYVMREKMIVILLHSGPDFFESILIKMKLFITLPRI